MGKGGDARLGAAIAADGSKSLPNYSAEEVAKHTNFNNTSKTKNDSWLVYRGQVYNISNFAARHPGGSELISTYEGQDATAVMEAFHPDEKVLGKYLKPLQIGSCKELATADQDDPVMKDFNTLTEQLREEGYFESNKWFFLGMYLHIVALEVLAYYLVAYQNALEWQLPAVGGYSFKFGYVIIALIQGLANAQGAWLQHDAGHKAIFGTNNRLNFWAQQLTMGCLVGASRQWWKDRHSRHHGKTNIYQKDPDIAGRGIILFGDVQFLYPNGNFIFKPLIPYQAFTFVFAAAPFIMTWLFVRPIVWHVIVNGNYWDAIFGVTFYIRNYYLYYDLAGGRSGLLTMYFGLRVVQSCIFTWITQISHIPREIILDEAPSPNFNWVQMQCQGTLNVKPSLFNDWFTGHLNYQIEHHLWPRMPRHNYHKVAPKVQELCAKHNIDYAVLPHLFAGCKDVVVKIQQTADHFVEHEQKQKKKEKAL